jgi:hypothetical protein
LEEAHDGTLPRVKTKLVTPWDAAWLMIESSLVQLKPSALGSNKDQEMVSQSRMVVKPSVDG